MTDKIVVFTTCSSVEDARRIAAHLVDVRLAACVGINPALTSLYRWQGAVEEAQEYGLAIKTRRDLFPLVAAELCKLHTYEVPELIAVPIVDGLSPYLDWMDGALLPPQQAS